MKNLTIAIIDSGLGGLSLFKTFLSKLDVKNYIYFADLKNLPYGSKSREELTCITLKNVRNIVDKYRPHAIVFGCNTIGTTIFKYIKNSFPDLPLFAVRPNLSKRGVAKNKRTLVLATSATINALSKVEHYQKNKDCIVLCKMPKLARKVENYIQSGTNLVPYLKAKLKRFKEVDRVVLGCTHYYFIKDIISNLYPKARIVDGVLKVTRQIKSFFKLQTPNANIKPCIKWHLTASKQAEKEYKKVVQKIIKNQNK